MDVQHIVAVQLLQSKKFDNMVCLVVALVCLLVFCMLNFSGIRTEEDRAQWN